jgi:predicted phage terminase large subunit-like protein
VPRALTALNIEATQHQSTFVREVLGRTRLPASPVYPDSDKVTRARALAARFEGHKVYFLRGAPGMGTGPTDPGEFPRQLLAFPNGEHDDLVDAAVYAADLNGTGNDFYFTSGRRF